MLKPSKVDSDEGVTIPLNPTQSEEEAPSSFIKHGRSARRESNVTFLAVEDTKINSNVIEIPEKGAAERQKKGMKEIGKGGKMPVVRIATEAKLRTITHKVKKPAVDIEFHDLVYTAKTTSGSKTILKSISGNFESGKLSAIMGPSGAGKTTLLNILIGYVQNGVGGTILTNNHPRNMHYFNKLSCYIMQEDLLRKNLTVFESMLIASHLKVGKELNKEEKVHSVEEIIICMGLEKCKNVKTNNLSGGQRKRTSIAVELVNNPPVLFLDEPTTGLDTVTTSQVLELLKDLAKQGRTVVCTLHQPSSSLFHMLDHVYFVANGNCIYQGAPSQLVPFLSNIGLICKSTYNPADYILEILNKDTIKDLSQEIQNGRLIKCEEIEMEKKPHRTIGKKNTLAVIPAVFARENSGEKKEPLRFPIGFMEQFFILYKRKLIIQRRDTQSLWILFLHHLCSALLLGAIFYGVGNDGSRPFDNFKFCISVLIFFMYTFTMAPVLLMPEEVKLLEREYFNRWYSLKAYYAVTLVSSLIPLLLFGTMFQVIVYFLTDQPRDALRFFNFWLTGILSACISEGFGLLVGSICGSATGSIITPMMLVPSCVVAVYGMGFGQNIESFMQVLMSLSYVRYLLEATCVSLYSNRPEMHCPSDTNICMYKDPKLLLRDLGMLNTSLLNQFIVLINFYVFIRVLAYLALRYRLNKELSNKAMTYMKKLLKRNL